MPGPERLDRIHIGRIARPHGLAGEVVVRGVALSPRAMQEIGPVRLVRDNGVLVAEAVITRARPHGPDLLVFFSGVTSVERASELRGLWLEVERSALPDAGPGQIYYFELLGLEVVDEGGAILGRVREITATGAHELLEVTGEAGNIFIPYHAGTILGWDPAARRLTVRLPDGLLDVYRRPPSPGE